MDIEQVEKIENLEILEAEIEAENETEIENDDLEKSE